MLLNQAQSQTEQNAHHGSHNGDESSFEHKHIGNLLFGSTEIAQRDGILTLVDNQHGEGTNDVETGNEQDEREENIGNQLLHFHDAERVFLLLIAVHHLEFIAQLLLKFLLRLVDIRTALQCQFHSCHIALSLKEPTSKTDVRDSVAIIIFSLANGKCHTWRIEFLVVKTTRRVIEVDALTFSRRINLNRWKISAQAQRSQKIHTQHTIINDICTKLEGTIAITNSILVNQILEIVVHPLDGRHHLSVIHGEQRIVFQRLTINGNQWVLLQFLQLGFISCHVFPVHWYHLQLRVESREKSSHHVLKPVEHRKDTNHRRSSYGNTTHGDARDDIDGCMRLLRNEVSLGYVEGKRHLLFQQIVNVLDIVERIVEEELQFRNDTKLMTFERTQLVTNGTCLFVHVLQDFLCTIRREHAQVCLCHTEVGAHAHHTHRDQQTMCLASLFLENCAQILLNQSSNLILSCCFHF